MRLEARDLIPHILNRKGSRNRYVIGIDGPGAAGKSYLADQILAQMTDVQIVHFDDFYLDNDSEDGTQALGSRFDWARLEQQVLLPLSNNQKANYQAYDWQQQ
jgi:uridine kinase